MDHPRSVLRAWDHLVASPGTTCGDHDRSARAWYPRLRHNRARAARLNATMILEGWDESSDAVYDWDVRPELCTLRFIDERRDPVIMDRAEQGCPAGAHGESLKQ